MANDDATNILVVDDLPEKRLVYRTILEEMGQNLVAVGSGEEALAQVLKTEFAVILLDVRMPGLDGLETASLIRRRRKSAHTPIIFLTAFADEVHVAEGYAQGAVDYITTPVVPEILRAKVRVFVDLYRMAQQVRRQAEERVALVEERSKRAAAEEANLRLAFLADASRVLAGSLDPGATAQALARLVVPSLADLAGLTLAGDQPGRPWQTELAWVYPPARQVHTRWLAAGDGPADDLLAAVDRALATGRPDRLEGLDIAYPAADHPAPPGHRLGSAVVLPLRARGRTLGVLTLAYGASGRHHDPADLATAEDLASRAAVALDNARLYHEVQQADRQKNEFLSMLAHELRNPLAPIRNAVEVMRHRGPAQPELQWARDVIDRQVRHLARLVDDLLDVSRITRGKIRLQTEPVELAAVVAQAVEAGRPAIDARGHTLTVDLPNTPVWVNGDPARLAQVLTNLLNNAAKYTDDGGRVGLSIGREGNEVVIRVRDTGIGIPAEMLGAVFDLFTQMDRSLDRSQGGLGVGLTLVKRLVELHGGTVGAHSDGPWRGSEFVVRLPVIAGPGAAPAESQGQAPDHKSAVPLRVLVVDDNADAAESLAALLRLDRCEVRVAGDWESAAAAVAGFAPDAALLDIGLPDVDGYEIARRLRDRADTRRAVLVAVTGYGRDEDRAKARESGFEHHLVKPVEYKAIQELFATIRGRPREAGANGFGPAAQSGAAARAR
jgi:signal transduction histidine kinase/DNA-binding response OmpR family regulator